jgi:quinol monooxygenase YgiN
MSATEFARLTARPGLGDELERRLRLALEVVTADKGCRRAAAFRCVEDPDVFLCEIEWTSIAAHEEWRGSPALEAYRSHIGDVEGAPIEFAHYRRLVEDTGPTS